MSGCKFQQVQKYSFKNTIFHIESSINTLELLKTQRHTTGLIASYGIGDDLKHIVYAIFRAADCHTDLKLGREDDR